MPVQSRDEQRRRCTRPSDAPPRVFGNLQIILWSIWTIVVLGRGYLYMRSALLAAEPVDLLGLVIHSILVGVIGLVVLTIIETHLEPWRFMEEDDL